MPQVECSVLPQLGAKKQGSDKGAAGPITVQAPLSIRLQDSPSGLDPTSALPIDGQTALALDASRDCALSMLTANGGGSVLSSVASDSTVHRKQATVRGSRGGSSKRKKRAADATDGASKAEQAGGSEAGRASKQHKPDLSLLQEDLLRWVSSTSTHPHSLQTTASCRSLCNWPCMPPFMHKWLVRAPRAASAPVSTFTHHHTHACTHTHTHAHAHAHAHTHTHAHAHTRKHQNKIRNMFLTGPFTETPLLFKRKTDPCL